MVGTGKGKVKGGGGWGGGGIVPERSTNQGFERLGWGFGDLGI